MKETIEYKGRLAHVHFDGESDQYIAVVEGSSVAASAPTVTELFELLDKQLEKTEE
jgi:hypothetical protein